MNRQDFVAMIGFILLLLSVIGYSFAQPTGANITFNSSETKTPAAAQYLNTSGGSFTTIILDAVSQNLKWKAYAGNVTGVLTLDDSGDYTIFQWEVTAFTGEVYASRNNSIAWTNISCANETHIGVEENALNHTTTNIDSINSTFNNKIHRQFYVGNTQIGQSSCRSAFTWVNDTAQTASLDAVFPEVLLYDGRNLVYTTFIDDNTQGFNYKDYDFQMIVPERGVAGYTNTRYYFYMEIQ